MDNEKTSYTATMTVSGIEIPRKRKLKLGRAIVVANSKAAGLPAPQSLLSNAVPESQTGDRFKSIARFLLVTAGESGGEISIERARDSCELSVFPLRLVTPAEILLSGLRIAPGSTDKAIEIGSEQEAVNPYGEVFLAQRNLMNVTALSLSATSSSSFTTIGSKRPFGSSQTLTTNQTYTRRR
jgi:hypothetical protein